MKKFTNLALALLFAVNIFAQIPGGFNYQAVIRDGSGNIMANREVTLSFAIIQGSESGRVIYIEDRIEVTNDFGLVNLEIGSGDPEGFTAIDWANGPYFFSVSLDGEELGTSPLLSVPYAVVAQRAIEGDLDADPTNELQDISLIGNELTINRGSTVILPFDSVPQLLSLVGNQLTISKGNTVVLPEIKEDGDSDPTNEIELPQQLTYYGGRVLKANGFGGVSWQADANTQLTEEQVDYFVSDNGFARQTDLEVNTSDIYTALDADSTFLKNLIDTETGNRTTAISDETTARENADAALEAKISSDSTYLKGLLDAETAARLAADLAIYTEMDADSTFLKNLIDTETGSLNTAISNEATARENADAALDAKISSDSTYLKGLLDAETAARLAADLAIYSALDADSTYLKNLIDTETANRTTAISDEATARENADAALAAKISSDSTYLKGLLDAETAERLAADLAIDTEMDADSTYLKNLIDTETANRTTAISDEATARENADAALAAKISSDSTYLKGLLDAETAARFAADLAIDTEMDADSTYLKNLIDTETGNRTTAISDEATARENADAVLAAKASSDSTLLRGLINTNIQAIKDTASAIRTDLAAIDGLTNWTESTTGNETVHYASVFTPNSEQENVDVALTPKGTGALVAQASNGTGTMAVVDTDSIINNRGIYAVDLQMDRGVYGYWPFAVASGKYAVISGGRANTASGDNSTVAGGRENVASGYGAVVGGGYENTASETGATISGGMGNTASGLYSTITGGIHNTAASYGESVTGLYATIPTGQTATSFVATDRLFAIGNGTFDSRSDAFSILKNGNTTVGGSLTLNGNGSNTSVTLPAGRGTSGQVLVTDGDGAASWQSESDPAFAASQAANIDAGDITNLNNLSGVNSGDQDLSALASKTALTDTASAIRTDMAAIDGLTNWTESTYSFSSKEGAKFTPASTTANVDIILQPKGAGAILAQQPDGTTTGGNTRGINAVDFQKYRIANTQVASGEYATIAGGYENSASGKASFVAGRRNAVTGMYGSIIGGYNNTASGEYTSIFGSGNTASGNYSAALGRENTANSYAEMVVGNMATIPEDYNVDTWVSTDRLFAVGNGSSTRSDALSILKNGNTTVGGSLTLNGNGTNTSVTLPAGRGTSGQVLVTDGAGAASWQPESDPAFAASQAANIDAADITNLANLSGTNSGDQDLSALASKTALADTAAAIRTDMAAIDGLTNWTETAIGSETINYASVFTPNSWQTNVDIVLTPKGTGALVAQASDGSTINNRGIYAVDLQMNRSGDGNYPYAVASGQYAVISGGRANIASGEYSTVSGGQENEAEGPYSFAAGGQFNHATGLYASVLGGRANQASGPYSLAFGAENRSSELASVTFGYGNRANGYYSFAAGFNNSANSYGETVFGYYATSPTAGTASSAVSTDRLFAIGNGTSTVARSNAFSILKNGNTTVGGSLTLNGNGSNTSLTLPAGRGTSGQVLVTDGAGASSWQTETDPVFTASQAANIDATDIANLANLSGTNSGDQDLSAFASKTALADTASAIRTDMAAIDGLTNWEEYAYTYADKEGAIFAPLSTTANVDIVLRPKGTGSIIADIPNGSTSGGNVRGIQSVDLQFSRNNNTQVASGMYSVITGGAGNTADQSFSTVSGGVRNTAKGYATVSGGQDNTASGLYSTITGGLYNTAASYGETVTGLYATIAVGQQSNRIVSTDRLFAIGNGTSDSTRSDALSILKNGNTTVGGSLMLNGNGSNTSLTLPAGRGTSGQVLVTDGAGAASWQTESDPAFTASQAANIDAGDIANLANLTGTNSGDQDLSALASKTALADTASAIRSDLAAIDGLTNWTESTTGNESVHYASVFAPNSTQTNVDVALTPKGTGALVAQASNGTGTMEAVGTDSIINSRGMYAVDLQMDRLAEGYWPFAVASGQYAVISGGRANTASGQYSTVSGGQENEAAGENSLTAGGRNNHAKSAYASVVGGYGNYAYGNYSFLTGYGNYSLGHGSVAFGYNNSASGYYSVVGGVGNSNGSYAETVLGHYATTHSGAVSSVVSTDRLFAIGNGTSTVSRSNALSILKNGNTTVGGSLTLNGNGTNTSVTLPTGRGTSGQVLVTDGAGASSWQPETDPAFTASQAANIDATDITNLNNLSGVNSGDQDLSALASKTALADTASAIRTDLAAIDGLTNWAESTYSFAANEGAKFTPASTTANVDIVLQPKGTGAILAQQPDGTTTGGNTRGMHAVDFQKRRIANTQVASGEYATIGGGTRNKASGDYSTVSGGIENAASGASSFVGGGWFNVAGEGYSTVAGGGYNSATGFSSAISGGGDNTASGYYSFVAGRHNIAGSYAETVLGNYATIKGGNATVQVETDRLFAIGNGTSTSVRSDALSILKNGNTTVGGSLTLNGNGSNTSLTLPAGRGTSGQVLVTDGAGAASWQSESDPAYSAWDKDYADLINTPSAPDGSETKLTAGTNVTITGSGTSASPYVVNATSAGGSDSHYVGELYGGGVVFWVDHTGQHGLIASMIDLSVAQAWSNVSSTLIGATAQSDWDGNSNTTAITAQSGHTSSAAQLCEDYTNADYGNGIYSDWYLPSRSELNHLWNNLYEVQKALDSDGNGSTTAISKNHYWSSTENTNTYACVFLFRLGSTDYGIKTSTNYVRAIRAF